MKNIITSPNQRKLTIKRDLPQKGSKEIFTVVKNSNLYQAARNLTGNEFKLYVTLLSICSKEEYSMAFSPKYINSITGMSEDTIRKLFLSLENKQYIVGVEGHRNSYEFYEQPQKVEAKEAIELPTLYILHDGYYYTKEALLSANNPQEVEDFWAPLIKYRKIDGRFVEVK